MPKRPRKQATWTIVFDDASAIRGVVEAVSAIMQRVIFKVARQTDKYVLMVDGADVGMTCCVSARLQLDRVTFASKETPEEFTFCVECKHVLVAIDNPSCAHGAMIMEGHDDATIHIRMQDPEQRSHEDSSELNTFVDGTPPVSLSTLDFKMLLEIDLSKLKEMIKKARKSHSEMLRIRIHVTDYGSKQRSLVVFSVKGDAYHCQRFCHETSRDEDGSLRVRAAADGGNDIQDEEEGEPVFEGVYPVEKIDAFIRILPCRMVVAKVMKSMPLMMTHSLGGGSDDSSHIRFLIAPINEDD